MLNTFIIYTMYVFQTLINVIGNHFVKADIQPNYNITLSKRILFTIWLLSKPVISRSW